MLPASLCAKIMVFRRITRIIEVVLNERAVEKREKIFRNICKVKNNPYLCTAFEKQGSSHEEFWRGGRVVDCGGLENRCTARYPGFESLSLRKTLKISKFKRLHPTLRCKVGCFVFSRKNL